MDERIFARTGRNTVGRLPKRGHYDYATIYGILDAHFLCHLSCLDGDQPILIPTAYGRSGDTLYIHGSSKSRMLQLLADGRPLCLSVTLLDGLVLARSVFHHSMNYRSVVIYSHAVPVEGTEKSEALQIITDQILPGRWAEARLPNSLEMKATTVLAIPIEEASAKIRTGPPSDDAPDYDLPIWAGVVPVRQVFDAPEPDPKLGPGISLPPSLSGK